MSSSEELGIIGKMNEDGNTVIYSLDNYIPEQDIVDDYPTLVVIKWEFDGSENAGMPSKELQEEMYLANDLFNELVESGASFRAYARTGNNFREYVYYCIDQPSFLHALNEAAEKYPRFPIDIVFYEDPEWSDYKNLIAAFEG